MSFLFFRRVLANPMQVGYLVPSSGFLTRQTARRIDFSKPRIIVELGPGEGCHTRQIVSRMTTESRLILIELDGHFAAHLREQFADDSRVTVLHADALALPTALANLEIAHPDYIISGIPFTIMDSELREKILATIASVMNAKSIFITYQFSNLISKHPLFTLTRSTSCLFNVPPLRVMELSKS